MLLIASSMLLTICSFVIIFKTSFPKIEAFLKKLYQYFIMLAGMAGYEVDGLLGQYGVCHYFGSVDNGQCDSVLCGWGPLKPGDLET